MHTQAYTHIPQNFFLPLFPFFLILFAFWFHAQTFHPHSQLHAPQMSAQLFVYEFRNWDSRAL